MYNNVILNKHCHESPHSFLLCLTGDGKRKSIPRMGTHPMTFELIVTWLYKNLIVDT